LQPDFCQRSTLKTPRNWNDSLGRRFLQREGSVAYWNRRAQNTDRIGQAAPPKEGGE
jgi:hypothetical protein